MTLTDARSNFLLSLRVAGCTPKTLAYDAQGLDTVERFCAAHGIADAVRLSPTLLRAYVGELLERPGLPRCPRAPTGARSAPLPAGSTERAS